MAVLLDPSALSAGLAPEPSADPPVVLDVRWTLGGPPGIDGYRAGHLPTARFVDLERDLATSRPTGGAGGRHPLPSAEVFQAAMRRVGVCSGSRVVVYDGGADGFAAARAWWCLRYFGHPGDRVAILDGGYRAWTAAGLPTERTEPGNEPGDFVAVPGGMPALDAASAAELAGAGVLLDARAAPRYRGEQEPIDPEAGHIPGARSAPTADNLRADGTFRPPAELRTRFAELGAEADGGPVGTYCGSGVSAAQQVFALELAGVPAALYVGSWSDWVSDPERPIATGQHP